MSEREVAFSPETVPATDAGVAPPSSPSSPSSGESGASGGSVVPGIDPGIAPIIAEDDAAGGRGRMTLSPEWAKRLDIGITVAGLVVVTLLAAGLAVIEALYAPLRIGGVRAPVSLVMAVVTNPLLGWFAFTTTGRRFAALLPAAAWCVIWVFAAGRTSEGDLIITDDNWVGLLTLFAGPLAFAIGIYVSAVRQRPVPGPVSIKAAGPANSEAAGLAPRSVDG